jgi:hypothetical protein
MDSYKHDTIVVNDSYLLWENEGNNMIDKVIRIFNIINAIQANPGISATDLAFKCDVDIQGAPDYPLRKSTIQRAYLPI